MILFSAKHATMLCIILILVGCAPTDALLEPTTTSVMSKTPNIRATLDHRPSNQIDFAPELTQAIQIEKTATQQAVIEATSKEVMHRGQQLTNLSIAWPMAPFTDSQIEEARQCDLYDLYQEHYQQGSIEAIPSRVPLVNACDWAALAAAYVFRTPETDAQPDLPEIAHVAFRATVSQNPAMLLKYPLYYAYFGTTNLVEPPPISQVPVTRVEFEYSIGYIGYHADVEGTIENASTENAAATVFFHEESYGVEGQPDPLIEEQTVKKLIDPFLVLFLSQSFTDLIPIDAAYYNIECTDYYPSWIIHLTYADGTVLRLDTLSNHLQGGGPWHITINDQDYIQYGFAIPMSLNLLSQSLEIEEGANSEIACAPYHDLFDLAFPDR